MLLRGVKIDFLSKLV